MREQKTIGEVASKTAGAPVVVVSYDRFDIRHARPDRVERVARSGICTTSGGRRWHSDGTPIKRGKRAQLLTIEAAIAWESVDLAEARKNITHLRPLARLPGAELTAALDRGDYLAARKLVDRAHRAMCDLHEAMSEAHRAAHLLGLLEAHRGTE